MGAIPEALSVEAPQGQPRNHRRHPKQVMSRSTGERWPKAAEKNIPTVVTVDKRGHERKWGPLSRASAWKAGCFYVESKGDAKVYLEKDGARKDVDVEKRVAKGGPMVWFKDKKPNSP